jgi:hypothetical protein
MFFFKIIEDVTKTRHKGVLLRNVFLAKWQNFPQPGHTAAESTRRSWQVLVPATCKGQALPQVMLIHKAENPETSGDGFLLHTTDFTASTYECN